MSAISHQRIAIRPSPAHRLSADLAADKVQVKILMVDDQPDNLLVLEAVLEGLGHRLVRARSGEEALKCLLQEDFAVILLDVFMPGMDGFETAQFIRQRERSRYTPIVFLTAIGKSETHVSRGYSVGAVDYLFKPIVPEILKAKVSAFVEMFLKTATVAEQAEQLREFERQRHQAELAEAQRQLEAEKLQQEVRAARKVQQLLFPSQSPACSGFDIAGASYAADATGGDYFDYIDGPDGALDIVIADVSGHGFAAALLMAATRAYLRGLALVRSGIDEVLALANRALAADTDGDRFVTLLYLRLDARAATLSFVSAGHPDGYIISPTGEVKTKLQSSAMPLGVMPDAEFPAGAKFALESGDLIFLFTDGVVEACAPDGTPFGTTRALQVLRKHHSSSSQEIVEALHQSVIDFMKQPLLQDDFTTIVIKVA